MLSITHLRIQQLYYTQIEHQAHERQLRNLLYLYINDSWCITCQQLMRFNLIAYFDKSAGRLVGRAPFRQLDDSDSLTETQSTHALSNSISRLGRIEPPRSILLAMRGYSGGLVPWSNFSGATDSSTTRAIIIFIDQQAASFLCIMDLWPRNVYYVAELHLVSIQFTTCSN